MTRDTAGGRPYHRCVSAVVLRSLQPVQRATQLRSEGILLGEWSHVPFGTEKAYGRMVTAMAERGIDCQDRPPIWAWHGVVRLVDVVLLLDVEHELSRGFAVVTFTAPADLVLISDYGHWCEALFRNSEAWDPEPPVLGPHPSQATLPYLRAEWVDSIDPLPIDGWDSIDLDQPP